ncbi:hypothetical protein PCYB_062560 [Plasmodium cynomolgi strain B]|uniref:DNA endonuclease activator Ctp1 C-terminal domain-containing protein n=1 Tax=Plasmodium cynomolgi (strain B) TaxID=1120755 RepID=K6UR66_PLACD|nr:hypothetical protein PCYB_062560 [Plasmodium cynomolgi strain B]GAB65524.1 hypothetical protein PCYB_062560 [Plasmodium cynomolgi strain B]
MATFKSICEDSLKERKENVGLERVLGRVFDELISEFKAKFIKKISVLIHEVKHSDSVLEVAKGGVHYKRGKYESRQKEREEGKTRTDDTLGVYLSSFTDSKRKSLFEKIKKEINDQGVDDVTERRVAMKKLITNGFTTLGERKIYDAKEKVNLEDYGKKKIDEVSVLDRKGSTVGSARNELSDMQSKAGSRKSGRSARSRDVAGDGDAKRFEELGKFDGVEKRNMSEASEQLSMSDMSERSHKSRASHKSRTSRTNRPGEEDLCMPNGESNKSEKKDAYTNLISKYTVKRLFSNRLHTDELSDTHCGSDERRAEPLRSAHIDKARRYMHVPNGTAARGKEPSSISNEWKNAEDKNYKIVKRDFDERSKRSTKSKANSKANSLGSEHDPLDFLIEAEANERKELQKTRGRSNGNFNMHDKVEVKSHKGDSTSVNKSEQLFFEVIRGKRRKHLKGFECKDCKSFYEELCWDGSDGGKKYKRGAEHRPCNRHEVSKHAQNELLLKKEERGEKPTRKNYTSRVSEYVNENYTNGREPHTAKSFGEMALVSSARYLKSAEESVDMSSGKYAERCIDKFMAKFEVKGENKDSLVKMDQVQEEEFYEVDEADKAEEQLPAEVAEEAEDAEERRKENKKKKLIQSFSRHRYHSKVNDSPKNFWSFDFFK